VSSRNKPMRRLQPNTNSSSAEAKRLADRKAAEETERRKAEAAAAEKRREEQRAELERIKADAEKRSKASLDTDANTCVSNAEMQLNASFQGNTAARVINGCGVPVDIRVCLMTEGGWNCGVAWGVASQAGWSHSTFKATGPVFVDARVSGSNKPLRQPN
jgi:single-stranded DNA-specific DHH superfamily exonuclease